MSHRHISTNTLQQANSQQAILIPKQGCHKVIPPSFVLLNSNIRRSTISLADPEAHRPPVQMSTGGFFTRHNVVHPPPSDVKTGTATPLQTHVPSWPWTSKMLPSPP
jgi:hypothetical protein